MQINLQRRRQKNNIFSLHCLPCDKVSQFFMRLIHCHCGDSLLFLHFFFAFHFWMFSTHVAIILSRPKYMFMLPFVCLLQLNQLPIFYFVFFFHGKWKKEHPQTKVTFYFDFVLHESWHEICNGYRSYFVFCRKVCIRDEQ